MLLLNLYFSFDYILVLYVDCYINVKNIWKTLPKILILNCFLSYLSGENKKKEGLKYIISLFF